MLAIFIEWWSNRPIGMVVLLYFCVRLPFVVKTLLHSNCIDKKSGEYYLKKSRDQFPILMVVFIAYYMTPGWDKEMTVLGNLNGYIGGGAMILLFIKHIFSLWKIERATEEKCDTKLKIIYRFCLESLIVIGVGALLIIVYNFRVFSPLF